MWLSYLDLTLQTMLLGLEAHAVIGLRLNKIAAGGPAAMAEAHQMVTEKIGALAEAAGTLAVNGSFLMVVSRFRTHVRANEARLLTKPQRPDCTSTATRTGERFSTIAR
ncbi:MAG TPA: hypothetical protein VH858_10310 [Hyphomicrobiales bacterium]|jgi:hypothetical protein